MKTLVKIAYIITSILFLGYLLIPSINFPQQIDNSKQSVEPGDMESPTRRGYYTDLTRSEVLSFYELQFQKGMFAKLPFTYRLNYPPEDSQTLIRDQTRSTFLEEIVHPFRESLYVNGFEPKEDKDMIIVDGKVWDQKIILKLITSGLWVRLVSGVLVIILLPVLASGWASALNELAKQSKKIWTFR